MRKKLNKTVASFFFLIAIGYLSKAKVASEDPKSQWEEFTVNIGKRGNAEVLLNKKMNPSYWVNFRRSPIFHDTLLARNEMEDRMALNPLVNFRRTIDLMNHTATLSFKAKGYAQCKNDGQWFLKIDIQNPKVARLTDNRYKISGLAYQGNLLIHQIYKIHFPVNSKKLTQVTDEFGKVIFVYNLDKGTTSKVSGNKIFELILLLSALYFIIKWVMEPNKEIQNPDMLKA